MSIVKDTGLSSTHVSWEPWSHSWFFTVKTVLTNLRIFSHVYLPFYTTKVYYWSLPLCCVHQNTSSNVTMTSCLLTVAYLSYRHSSVIVSIPHSGQCLWLTLDETNPSFLCCCQLPAGRCELCVLQRLLSTLTSRFIQLAFGIRLKWALNLPNSFAQPWYPRNMKIN